jgi:hypothetical protein
MPHSHVVSFLAGSLSGSMSQTTLRPLFLPNPHPLRSNDVEARGATSLHDELSFISSRDIDLEAISTSDVIALMADELVKVSCDCQITMLFFISYQTGDTPFKIICRNPRSFRDHAFFMSAGFRFVGSG